MSGREREGSGKSRQTETWEEQEVYGEITARCYLITLIFIKRTSEKMSEKIQSLESFLRRLSCASRIAQVEKIAMKKIA